MLLFLGGEVGLEGGRPDDSLLGPLYLGLELRETRLFLLDEVSGLLLSGEDAEPPSARDIPGLSIEQTVCIIVSEGVGTCLRLLIPIGRREDLTASVKGGKHAQVPVPVSAVALNKLHEKVLLRGQIELTSQSALGGEELHHRSSESA